MKKTLVISLGGSLIVPEKMNATFLTALRKTLKKHYKSYKFVIVCGGGTVARKYISALRTMHHSEKDQSLAGIRATCLNAEFMMELFGKEANSKLPHSMKETKTMLAKNNVVFCCAFRYVPNRTSDTTAAELASYLKGELINLSNIDRLYTKDPTKHKDAKPIDYISWSDFYKMAHKLKFKAGQHFVLDQTAATLIRKNKTMTYLLGSKITNLSRLLESEKFIGTTIGP